VTLASSSLLTGEVYTPWLYSKTSSKLKSCFDASSFGGSESSRASPLLKLPDGELKVCILSYVMSCTLVKRGVAQPTEDTVRQKQLGPQEVVEPEESGDVLEMEHIGDPIPEYSIWRGL
jgi:hypothetical protein